jgi:hypothetical protein
MQLVLDLIHQLREVLPLHLSALVMEIEPNILDKLIFNLVDNAGELCPDTKLRPFLVDQVNKYLLTVELLDLSHVLLGKMHGFLVILIDNDSWAPFHGRLLAPKGRDGSSGL